MELLTQDLQRRLIQNGTIRRRLDEEGEADPDFIPVVKLFTPDGPCTWLITELDPEDPEIGFGLCDIGMGFPELGSLFVPELESARGPLGMAIERGPPTPGDPLSTAAWGPVVNFVLLTQPQH